MATLANPQAETAVLGGLLIDASELGTVASIIGPDDFYRERNRLIFEVLLHLREQQVEIDLLTVTTELERRDITDEAGGLTYLTSLISDVPSAVHVEHYARIVADFARRRRAFGLASTLATQVGDGEADVGDVLAAHLDEVLKLRSVASLRYAPDGMRSLADQALDAILNGDAHKVPTGFDDLDKLLGGGLARDEFAIVAGRPGTGKTTFAMNMFRRMAMRGLRPLFMSLEMSGVSLARRLIAIHSGVGEREARANPALFETQFTAAAEIAEWDALVDSGDAMTVNDIVAKVKAYKPGVLIVDYIQLIPVVNNGRESREREVAGISRALKMLARSANVPVVGASQLNRLVGEGKPTLANLRESGALEQDTDVVVLMWQDPALLPTPQGPIISTIVAKNRNGPVGEFPLVFNKATGAFAALAREETDDVDTDTRSAVRTSADAVAGGA